MIPYVCKLILYIYIYSHLILLHYSTCPKDHVPEVKVLTTLGMFAVPVTAETTLGEIRQKVQDREDSTEPGVGDVTAMGFNRISKKQ